MHRPEYWDLLTIGMSSFLGALLLVPIYRHLTSRFGLTDKPDGRRKLQQRPIPLCGGLAILSVFGLVVGFAPLFLRSDLLLNDILTTDWLYPLFLATLILAIVGLVDDAIGLRGRHKLLGQLVAIAIVLSPGNVSIDGFTLLGTRIDLGVWGTAFTVFWLLGSINALNLIDGMDGLLGTITLMSSICFGIIAIMVGNYAVAVVAMALGGAIIGFLRYNLPPASVYLGDCGSMTIGLILGTLAIHGSMKGPAAVTLAIPIASLLLPILDTFAAVVRRKLTGRSIYTTDRGHLHHRLLASGLSRPRILLLVTLFGLLTAIGSACSIYYRQEIYAWLAGVSVLLVLLGTGLFGSAEVRLVRERIRGTITRFRQCQTDSTQMEVQLQGQVNWVRLWDVIIERAEQLDLQRVWLDVNAPSLHENYHARWDRNQNSVNELGEWRAELPLFLREQPVGRLTVTGQRDSIPIWEKMAGLSELVEMTEREVANLTAQRQKNIDMERTESGPVLGIA